MPPAIPLATYRIQFTADFGFDRAAAIVPYLKTLGISHLYASPFLKARRGSTHGYDIVDHNQLNPELGGDEGFERLSQALKAHDIGLILDFVPNHMGVHFADNAWWLDMLEWGKTSPYSASFDIDWDTLPYRSQGGVLLPILGSSYGEALESGQIELRYDADEGSFSAWYFEHRLPIAPSRYGELLRNILNAADAPSDPAAIAAIELAARYAGPRRPSRAESPAFKAELRAIAGLPGLVARGLTAYQAGPDRPAQTAALHSLLERQNYRLAHWRLATSEINYRRFFDVNSLAGLRVEDAATFDRIHGLVRRLIAEDKLQGLRLDHIDGLRDPAQYCTRLARFIREARPASSQPFYLLVEKILGEHELPPRLTGVHGTTGYEWLNVITQVLVDGDGLEQIDQTWLQASNIRPDLAPVLEASKHLVLNTLLASEFTVLSRLLARIAAGHYSTRDFSADSLRQALELYVLHFPVYRTYLANAPSPDDRKAIVDTIEAARARWFNADEGIFDFLRDVITLDIVREGRSAPGKPRMRRFALKLQQFTGPMMAKSLEDTAFYRFHRLLALNEVGGNPVATPLSANDFHGLMQNKLLHAPHGMTATATHDTKRGEDARARLLALPELAGEWSGLVGRWKGMNAPHIRSLGGHRSPSVPFEYMLYQSLVGAWPDTRDATFASRMKAYAIKAAREAKLETSWLNPNASYENGLENFIECILDPSQSADFITSMEDFVHRAALIGTLNSLSQVTLKSMMPGVPDYYQGTEFWDHSLVDPDNRRPVDFEARQQALAEMVDPDWTALTADWQDGRLKLAWTRKLLRLRRDHAELFTLGGYRPISVHGPDRNHVVAFARCHKSEAVIVAVGRHFTRITESGRTWPSRAFDVELDLHGFSADLAMSEYRLSGTKLFQHFPAAAFYAEITTAKNSPHLQSDNAFREHGRTG